MHRMKAYEENKAGKFTAITEDFGFWSVRIANTDDLDSSYQGFWKVISSGLEFT